MNSYVQRCLRIICLNTFVTGTTLLIKILSAIGMSLRKEDCKMKRIEVRQCNISVIILKSYHINRKLLINVKLYKLCSFFSKKVQVNAVNRSKSLVEQRDHISMDLLDSFYIYKHRPVSTFILMNASFQLSLKKSLFELILKATQCVSQIRIISH